MQISKFSDFALRILIHLAVAGNERISSKDIALKQDESFNHLAKIAQWLAAEGYVEATRGRGGGMTLAKEPDQISVGALLRKSEASSPLVECMRADGGCCAFSPACGLLPMLSGAQEAFYQYLDPLTLADVIAKRTGMAALVSGLEGPKV